MVGRVKRRGQCTKKAGIPHGSEHINAEPNGQSAENVVKIGLEEADIDRLRKKAKEEGQKINDATYLIEDRNPIALIHLLENSNKDDVTLPKPIFALGLGFPKGQETRVANYMVNVTELKNYTDEEYLEDDDDDIVS